MSPPIKLITLLNEGRKFTEILDFLAFSEYSTGLAPYHHVVINSIADILVDELEETQHAEDDTFQTEDKESRILLQFYKELP